MRYTFNMVFVCKDRVCTFVLHKNFPKEVVLKKLKCIIFLIP